MTNRTKDIVFILLVLFVIAFTIFACGFAIGRSYAQTPEEKQITEIRNYVANMTDEEYAETFFKGE